MNGENTRDIASRVLAALEDANYIESALAAFLDKFPHYRKHRDKLSQECLMACTACAFSATLISRGCGRATTDGCTNRFRAEIEFEAEDNLFLGGLTKSDITNIAAYLESFDYVYSKRDCLSGEALLSPLSNMAFQAVTRVLGNNAFWNGSTAQNAPILHDFVLPLLVEVFNRFSTPSSQLLNNDFENDLGPDSNRTSRGGVVSTEVM